MRSVDEGVEFAMSCWTSPDHLNCTESVLRGVCFAQGIDLPDIAKKMATPFGGGVGKAEDLCGALAGGVLAIGASLGRADPKEDKQRCSDAAGELHKRFRESFGSTSCKVLNKGDFKSTEHRARCGRFVEGCTRFTIETIRKN